MTLYMLTLLYSPQTDPDKVIYRERDWSVVEREGIVSISCKGKVIVHDGRDVDDRALVRWVGKRQRFLVSIGGSSLYLFTPGGKLVNKVNYKAARDPHPLLIGDDYLVFGEWIYNWAWQDTLFGHIKRRSLISVRLKDGKRTDLGRWTKLGFPLVVLGKNLISIVPRDWNSMPSSRDLDDKRWSVRHYWLVRTDLSTGESIRRPTYLSAQDGRSMIMTIWDNSGDPLMFRPRSGDAKVEMYRYKDVYIKLPRAWLRPAHLHS